MKDFKLFQVRWDEPLPNKEHPYMIRYALVLFGYGFRLHHWLCGDDPRHYHDHPWYMWILVLKGSYTDVTPDGEVVLQTGKLYYRPAEHKHTVKLEEGQDCWTVLFTGPKTRNWGFYIPGREKLMRPLRYFSRYKHHQCD